MSEIAPEIRDEALRLFRVFHGPGDSGSEMEFWRQSNANGWFRLASEMLIAKESAIHYAAETAKYSSQSDSHRDRLKTANDALSIIGKICTSSKHKDPISDILCEVNRAARLQVTRSTPAPAA